MSERAPDRQEQHAVPLRSPDTVMRLERMGCFHQTRLSFMRALLRRLKRDGWRFSRPLWRVDARGEGVAVYRAQGPDRVYSLVCLAHDLPDELRSDRVIAERWDATFTLFDGEPSEDDLARIAANVPLQEAGRCSASELVLSRANRSVRLFEHVVARLAAGEQPDREQIDRVGYLMRTTAVYGNGKFGIADRERIAGREALDGPFRAEMLTVWLIRAFTVDLVEHMAAARAPASAVRMQPQLRRALGVGNSTGLGMAPFLVTHPALLNAWMTARETALARVRALDAASPASVQAFLAALGRARCQVAGWRTVDERQRARIVGLATDLERLAAQVAEQPPGGARPWDRLFLWGEHKLGLEAQEMLVTLLIEPHGELVDDLAEQMACDERECFVIDGSLRVSRMRELIERDYGWALATDFESQRSRARFWYVSEEKLEPRLGDRGVDPGAELEQPFATGRDVRALHRALVAMQADTPLADLLLAAPEHRHPARRVQIAASRPYAEVRDNLVGADFVPVDLLRCKLSFFGATRFDPRSDRWVRINMYKDAPFPDEFDDCDADAWALPGERS